MSDLKPSPEEAAEIEEYRQRYGKPGMTAGDFHVYLPEHLRAPYWRMKILEFAIAEGYEKDEEVGL